MREVAPLQLSQKMPELPEVETTIQSLKNEQVINQTIVGDELKNRTILDIKRRGKYIIFSLNGGQFLLIHLGMSGHLILTPHFVKHERMRIVLQNGIEIAFQDPRKFGKIILTGEPEKILASLGIEPLEMNFQTFDKLVKGSVPIKSFLLNQKKVAGIGNIYADEALFEARIHPLRRVNSLLLAEKEALFKAIQIVLLRGIENRGTSLGKSEQNFSGLHSDFGNNRSFLKIYGRKGQKCFHCSGRVEKIVIGQRGSSFCPNCQPFLAKKPLSLPTGKRSLHSLSL